MSAIYKFVFYKKTYCLVYVRYVKMCVTKDFVAKYKEVGKGARASRRRGHTGARGAHPAPHGLQYRGPGGPLSAWH